MCTLDYVQYEVRARCNVRCIGSSDTCGMSGAQGVGVTHFVEWWNVFTRAVGMADDVSTTPHMNFHLAVSTVSRGWPDSFTPPIANNVFLPTNPAKHWDLGTCM